MILSVVVIMAEKKVLKELRMNARQSNERIAKNIGVTRQTVRKIIKKLEEDKIIWGYTAVAPEAYLFYNDLHLFLVQDKAKKDIDFLSVFKLFFEKEFPEILKTWEPKRMLMSFMTFGDYDINLMFFAKDMMDARKIFYSLFDKHLHQLENYSLLEVYFQIQKLKKELKKYLIKNQNILIYDSCFFPIARNMTRSMIIPIIK
jgi:DNA-binding Lrp family transcriptional regulator